MASKRVIYWDTCIFIAHVTGEPLPEGVREGMDDVVRDIDNDSAVLVTSAITLTEILEGKYTPQQWGTLNALFDRPNCILIALDTRVAKLAGQIRNHYQTQKPPIKIETPDAVHLASAIAWKVSAFHTLDGSGKTSKASSILRFNGNVMNLPLLIEVPSGEPNLFIETRAIEAAPETTSKTLPPKTSEDASEKTSSEEQKTTHPAETLANPAKPESADAGGSRDGAVIGAAASEEQAQAPKQEQGQVTASISDAAPVLAFEEDTGEDENDEKLREFVAERKDHQIAQPKEKADSQKSAK